MLKILRDNRTPSRESIHVVITAPGWVVYLTIFAVIIWLGW